MRRCDLTLRVTYHRLRAHSARFPEPCQRHHQGKQHGLHHVDPLQRRRIPLAPKHILQLPIHVRRERLLAGPHALREHIRAIQQLHRHAWPLAALTGEQEHGPAAGGTSHALDHTRRGLAASQRPQTSQQPLPAIPHNHAAVPEHRAPDGQREPHVGWARLGVGAHVLEQPRRLSAQPALTLPGDDPRRGGAEIQDTAISADGGPTRGRSAQSGLRLRTDEDAHSVCSATRRRSPTGTTQRHSPTGTTQRHSPTGTTQRHSPTGTTRRHSPTGGWGLLEDHVRVGAAHPE